MSTRPKYYLVLILRKQKHSYEQIGQLLGVSRQRAFQIYQRAASRARRRLPLAA